MMQLDQVPCGKGGRLLSLHSNMAVLVYCTLCVSLITRDLPKGMRAVLFSKQTIQSTG